jgi:hypothetical protein
VLAVLACEDRGAGLHLSDGGFQHGHDGGGVGGVGAVPIEDGAAIGQLHQLRVSGQHPNQAITQTA